jgi:uncharacterized protein with HEPN domain
MAHFAVLVERRLAMIGLAHWTTMADDHRQPCPEIPWRGAAAAG